MIYNQTSPQFRKFLCIDAMPKPMPRPAPVASDLSLPDLVQHCGFTMDTHDNIACNLHKQLRGVLVQFSALFRYQRAWIHTPAPDSDAASYSTAALDTPTWAWITMKELLTQFSTPEGKIKNIIVIPGCQWCGRRTGAWCDTCDDVANPICSSCEDGQGCCPSCKSRTPRAEYVRGATFRLQLHITLNNL